MSGVVYLSVYTPNDSPDDKTVTAPRGRGGIRVNCVFMCGLGCVGTHTLCENVTGEVLHLHTRTHTRTYTLTHTRAQP